MSISFVLAFHEGTRRLVLILLRICYDHFPRLKILASGWLDQFESEHLKHMQPVGEKGDVEENDDDEDDDKDEDEDASAPEEVQAKGQQTGVAAGKAGAPAVIGPENRKSPPVNSGDSVVVETKTKKPAGAKEGDPAVAERENKKYGEMQNEDVSADVAENVAPGGIVKKLRDTFNKVIGRTHEGQEERPKV